MTSEANSNTEEGLTQLATSYIAAVGGTDNLKAIDACITRLRLTVGDSARERCNVQTPGCVWCGETEQTNHPGYRGSKPNCYRR
ncbi:PTS transporter subunit EIIB [Enterobacter hormaechei]